MTPILDIIRRHQGKDNAITAERIVDALGGYPGGVRRLRDEIKRLIEEEGQPIAACGTGYFIPITIDELNEYERVLDKKERSIKFRRLAIIKMRGMLAPEQMTMFEAPVR